MIQPWPFSAGFTFRSAKDWRQYADKVEGWRAYERKHDGWRVLITKDSCFSRGVSKETGLQIDLLDKGPIPALKPIQEVIDEMDAVEAELVYPGYCATDVPTALKSNRKALRVKAFSYAVNEDELITDWWRSRDLLEWLALQCGCERHDKHLISDLYGFGYLDIDTLLMRCKQRGWEGMMVKTEDAWFKLKRERHVDCVVVGTKDGKGKYEGLLGALVVAFVVDEPPWDYEADGLHLREVAAISGMTDEERVQMTGQDLTFEVCEVLCQAAGGKSRLRHPRFIRWRPDKPWTECNGDDNE